MIHQKSNSKSNHFVSSYFENTDFAYHFHDSYELIYVIEGALTIEISGLKISVNQNEFFMISPCVIHEIRPSSKYKGYFTIFSKDYVNMFFQENMEKLYFHFFLEDDIYNMYIKEIYKKKTEETKKYMVIACLNAICQSALNGKPSSQNTTKNMSFVFKVNKILSENFKMDIKRKDVADMLHYDEHYFSSIFSRSYSMNFREYLNVIRIGYAKNLLWHSDMNITEIAIESGFKSIRNFNAVFKAQTNMTPKQYRNNKSTEISYTNHYV